MMNNDLVKSLQIKRSNEVNEIAYQQTKNKMIQNHKDELEHFDREWYLKILEFEGSNQEVHTFSQSLPTLKEGNYTKYIRTQNTFANE